MAGKNAPMAMPDEYFSPQSDMHTLMSAHKIKSDPKRHAAAKAHAKSQLAAMTAISETAPTKEKQ